MLLPMVRGRGREQVKAEVSFYDSIVRQELGVADGRVCLHACRLDEEGAMKWEVNGMTSAQLGGFEVCYACYRRQRFVPGWVSVSEVYDSSNDWTWSWDIPYTRTNISNYTVK